MNKSIKNWISALWEAVLILLILYFVCFPARVEGSSMEQTLHHGDTLLICRVAAWMGWYDQGDVVTFSQQINGEKIVMVKRVIALEGDQVAIHDGVVTVNGQTLEEPYAQGITEDDLDVTVPVVEVFLLGDNRQKSTDSRAFGSVPMAQVQGKVFFRILPVTRIGFLTD